MTIPLLYWMNHGDLYQEGGELVVNAKELDAVVTDIYGLSVRDCYYLVEIETIPVLNDEKEIFNCMRK